MKIIDTPITKISLMSTHLYTNCSNNNCEIPSFWKVKNVNHLGVNLKFFQKCGGQSINHKGLSAH